MKKIEMNQMLLSKGGGKCEYTSGWMIGVGIGCLVSGGALIWVVAGGVIASVGAGSAASCPWY